MCGGSGAKEIKFENDTGLFVAQEDGKFSMYDDKFTYPSTLGGIDAQEYTIKTTKSCEFIPVENEAPEELVELMGQKYSKKELEDALRSLKPVN